MEHTQHTSQQILQTIVQQRGIGFLRENGGKYFVNAFAEMGGDKQDVRLLRYLTECGVHEDLLDAASLTPAMQKASYSQAVQKLRDKSLISEELAHRVCGDFWRAVYHREPPAAPQKPEKKTLIQFRPASPAPQSEDPEKLYQRGMAHQQDNLEEYLRCLRRAAELGHVGAARRLGFIYECGIDVPQDWVQCSYWCRKAAELGDDASAYTLGVNYAHGRGVPQDYEQALYWYRIAAERGVEFAKSYLPEIEKKAAQASKKNAPQKRIDNTKGGSPRTKERVHPIEKKQTAQEKWVSVLKWLGYAQILLSVLAVVFLCAALISKKEWTDAGVMLIHIGIIYGMRKPPEIEKEPRWRMVTGILLLFMAVGSFFGLIELIKWVAETGDFLLLGLGFGIFGMAPMLARVAIETMIGAKM